VTAGGGDGSQEQPGEALPPVTRGQEGVSDDGHGLVEHGVQQIITVLDIYIEGGRAGIEFLGHPAHARRIEALPVGDAQGGLHDRGAAQGGTDRAAPPTDRLAGTNAAHHEPEAGAVGFAGGS
jgi:hypothetical protein